MTTPDEALAQMATLIDLAVWTEHDGQVGGADLAARQITDRFYLIDLEDMPETEEDAGYVQTDRHTLSVISRPEELNAEAYSLLAIADRLKTEQAKKDEAERELTEKRDAWLKSLDLPEPGLATMRELALIHLLIDNDINPEGDTK